MKETAYAYTPLRSFFYKLNLNTPWTTFSATCVCDDEENRYS